MARKRAMATILPDPAPYTISADAIIKTMIDSHETTHKLMDVQFQAVRENLQRIHSTMAEVKADLKIEAQETKAVVEKNRSVAEERHISIVKRIWFGLGAVAVIEVLILAWLQRGH